MAEYMIRMADERGHVLEQLELGNSEGEVRERYAQQGYLVYSVKPKGLLSAEVRLPRRRKIKQDQFVIFNQQFVTLIHAGLPIIQSLELLMKRQRNPFFRTVLHNVRDRVRGGELLSEVVRGAEGFSQGLHHHAAGGREVGQPRRGAGALYRVSAAGGDVSARSWCRRWCIRRCWWSCWW